MSYRNARLANGFLSLDKLAKELDLVKSRTVSDSGAGVERMVGDIDRRPGEYVADLRFQRVGGSEGGEEIVAHDVTITVP